jgi:DNA (cytosine-5)-methyltransferase 1
MTIRTSLVNDHDTCAPKFIDLFAGCGGLSLGLGRSGWRGFCALEKDSFAFATLKANLIDREATSIYDWPVWLPQEPMLVETVFANYTKQLRKNAGSIDLVAGGPPCQGFSTAGKRMLDDPRNSLVRQYLKFIDLIRPKILLFENVHGMTMDFADGPEGDIVNYSKILTKELQKKYRVFHRMIDVSAYGVPQFRVRFFVVGLRKDVFCEGIDPFERLETRRDRFLKARELSPRVSSRTAISDLEMTNNGTELSIESPGFQQLSYSRPRTTFQRLMHNGCVGPMTNVRLANHRPDIQMRFAKIIKACMANGRLGTSIGKELREEHGLRKMALRVLDPELPSPTITSMPDDLLHYREPRTLTVRENARLQSFPDWFDFRGKYTSGGERRRNEVPRFTQVANAVPPLMAEALGEVLLALLLESQVDPPVPREEARRTGPQVSVSRTVRSPASPLLRGESSREAP